MSNQKNSVVSITVSFTENEINNLWYSVNESCFKSQRSNFTTNDEEFELNQYEDNNSFLYYTESFLDAKFLCEYFRKTGYSAHILSDESRNYDYCVITNKSYPL